MINIFISEILHFLKFWHKPKFFRLAEKRGKRWYKIFHFDKPINSKFRASFIFLFFYDGIMAIYIQKLFHPCLKPFPQEDIMTSINYRSLRSWKRFQVNQACADNNGSNFALLTFRDAFSKSKGLPKFSRIRCIN